LIRINQRLTADNHRLHIVQVLLKAARMQVLIIGSRHALTKNTILLARDMGIALLGQVCGDRLAVLPTRSGLAVQQIKYG